MRRLAGNSERLQVLHSVAVRHRIGNIGKSLRRLSDRDDRDDLVGQCVDGGEAITIFKPDIHPRSIT